MSSYVHTLSHSSRMTGRSTNQPRPVVMDGVLLATALLLLALGLVMIGSASIDIADRQSGQPFYYLYRQGAYVLLGLLGAAITLKLPLAWWQRSGPVMMVVVLILMLALFLPGLGRTVNGSTRWLALGLINLQVTELVKFAVVVYLAGYMVRRDQQVRTTVGGFLKPMTLVGLFALLALIQPDFGAATVIAATSLGMMFLGGVQLWLFGVLGLGTVGMMALLAVTSPYRMARLTGFLNPWADPFNSGFQLTQALIAFGRGEWFGVGVGGSVQKLFYLPEAHTDFVYAVLAEELGLLGSVTVVLLFALLVWRIFVIGRTATERGNRFGSYLAYGVALWLAMQAFINMGVNMGLLPTKGLTLPLMSYGGSSMIVSCVAVALVLRIGIENGPLGVTKRGGHR